MIVDPSYRRSDDGVFTLSTCEACESEEDTKEGGEEVRFGERTRERRGETNERLLELVRL